MEKMTCALCGGCALRKLEEMQYRQEKEADFKAILSRIKGASPIIDKPVFIQDGSRRRADLAFLYAKKKLTLGFNEEKSHNIVDIFQCPMLNSELNMILPSLRRFLENLCVIPITIKNKKKKIETTYIRNGSVHLQNADNGVDILLKLPLQPELEHRLAAADFVNQNPKICRISIIVNADIPETIAQKQLPELYISGCTVEIPCGGFLQASKKAETAMIDIMFSYMGDTNGKIADLFCGLGTFTYPLAKIKENEIISVDSSEASLQKLQNAIKRNQLHNITVINRNLFKYPFDADDLKGIKALVMDPPRAGAHKQCREIAKLSPKDRPKKIIFVSCNPQTFVYDAELLITSGYIFERVTLIDQFVYSKHQELIALFTHKEK